MKANFLWQGRRFQARKPIGDVKRYILDGQRTDYWEVPGVFAESSSGWVRAGFKTTEAARRVRSRAREALGNKAEIQAAEADKTDGVSLQAMADAAREAREAQAQAQAPAEAPRSGGRQAALQLQEGLIRRKQAEKAEAEAEAAQALADGDTGAAMAAANQAANVANQIDGLAEFREKLDDLAASLGLTDPSAVDDLPEAWRIFWIVTLQNLGV